MRISEKTALKSVLQYGLAFLLPALLITGTFAALGVSPFGQKSLLITDMSQLYIDFHAWFYDVLTGAQSPFFSFRAGMGMNMTGLLAFYQASPFSFLVLLFPKEAMPDAVLLITILKLGAAGLMFSIFAQRVLICTGRVNLVFSTLYALMSYAVVYTINIMWLDGVILLPLCVLCVHLLLTKGRVLPLIMSLFFLFTSQFYIAYMVGGCCALFFVAEYLLLYQKDWRNFLGKALRFLLCAVLSAGLSAFLLLPAWLNLQYAFFDVPLGMGEQTLSLFDMLSKMVFGSYDSLKVGFPNVYCGVLALFLVPLFFVNHEVNKREKLVAGGLLCLLFLSMAVWPLNLLWHGGDEPTWFPYRQSFLFCFACLVLSVRAFQKRRGLTRRQLVLTAVFCMLVVSILQAFHYEHVSNEMILCTILLMGLYAVLLSLLNEKKRMETALLWVLLLSVCFESFANSAVLVKEMDKQFSYQSRESYVRNVTRASALSEQAYSRDLGWYRLENTAGRNVNDALSVGYNAVSHYSSFTNRHVSDFLRALGVSATTQNRYLRYVYGSTPVTDALLGVKYFIAGAPPHPGYEQLLWNDIYDLGVYENPHALPFGYLVNQNILNLSSTSDGDPFVLQNSLLNLIAGDDTPYYSQVEGEADVTLSENLTGEKLEDGWMKLWRSAGEYASVSFTVNLKEDSRVFFYIEQSSVAGVVGVAVNGEEIKNGPYHITGVVDLGWQKAGELTVAFETAQQKSTMKTPLFYTFDEKAFAALCGGLKQGGMYDIVQGDTTITGTVAAQGDGLLLLSLPVDPGFSVTVDGEPAKLQSVAGALCAVAVEEGVHEVSVTFTPQGLRAGVVISLLSLALICLFCRRAGQKRRRRRRIL